MKLMIFDLDGVIVDVSKSYNLAIKHTVEFFLGRFIDMDIIDEFKNKSGFNNDWDCTEAILNKFGIFVKKKAIIKKFQEYYLGLNFNGLIKNEKLLLNKANIGALSRKYDLAVFTGRPKLEADFILDRFQIQQYFKMIVAMEDINSQKPNPEGLNKIITKLNANIETASYIGDSVDDAIAAKKAGIKFIGIIPPYADKERLENVFKENNAINILTDPNKLK
jgi:HAD superfamily hydrolase (TIGR01548 family)